MRLLRIEGNGSRIVLLFGRGLIGSAVDQALQRRHGAAVRDLPYDWNDGALRSSQRETIMAAVPRGGRVAVVWAGGRGGFASNNSEMMAEAGLVAEVIQLAESLRSDRRVDFHLVSSAGGLFEGQTHCSTRSVPHPLRPYGDGKLMQEVMLSQASLDGRHVYRPSSVYGAANSGRVGLVTMLVMNALKGGTTRIFGNPGTLRDYVMAEDVGRYVAQKIVDPEGPATRIVLLANGRSASVHEVIELVRARLERPLLLQFDPHPSNARNMSFLSSALPADWTATPLASGIARVVTFLRHRLS